MRHSETFLQHVTVKVTVGRLTNQATGASKDEDDSAGIESVPQNRLEPFPPPSRRPLRSLEEEEMAHPIAPGPVRVRENREKRASR